MSRHGTWPTAVPGRVAHAELGNLGHEQRPRVRVADRLDDLTRLRADHDEEPEERFWRKVATSRLMAGSPSISKQTLAKSARPIRVPLPAARMTTAACSVMPLLVSLCMSNSNVSLVIIVNDPAAHTPGNFKVRIGRFAAVRLR